MLNLGEQSQEMWIGAGLMGLAVLLFGCVMLLRPKTFEAISRARLKAHGGMSERQQKTWKRWHRNSAVFCVLLGMVVVMVSLARVLKPMGPFAPNASPSQRLAAFDMTCDAQGVHVQNSHSAPIWIRVAYPSVFGTVALEADTVQREPLETGYWLQGPVDNAVQVALRSQEVLELGVGESSELPLLGLSSADCGAGMASLALSPQGTELGLEQMQEAQSRCNQLQLQVALFENPNQRPSFVGWRGCEIKR